MNLVDLVIRPPVFEDDEKTRSAALLHIILILTTLANVLSILGDAIVAGYNLVLLRDNLIVLAVQIVMLVWMRKGAVRQIGLVFTIFGWLAIALAIYSNTGILNPLFASQALIVLIAGLLVNEWAAVGFAVLSIVYGLWLVNAAEAGQYVNQVGEISARHAWINYTSALVTTATLLWVSQRTIREVRNRAKRSAIALEQSEARYRALVDNAPATILMVNRDHRISLMSRTRSGRAQAVVGHEIYDYIPPDKHAEIRAKMERVFREGTTEQVEILTTNAQGLAVWYSNQFAPIWDGESVREVVIIATNITEQKRVEAELRNSEERYRDLFHSNPQAMWVMDLETLRFIDVNEAALKQYGYMRDEFLQQSIATIRPAEEVPEAIKRMEFIRQGDFMTGSGTMRRHVKKDGSVIYVEIAYHRLTYLGHDALVVAPFDMTEREKAKQALARSEELFSTIFQSVPVGMSITRVADGRITAVNDALLKLTGYEREELVGKLNLKTPVWYDRTQRLLVAKLTEHTGGFDDVELQWKTKSGQIVDITSSGRQVVIGDEAFIIGMGVDITERKQAEEALRRSESLLSKVFQLVPVAIAISTLNEGKILTMNPYQLDMLGYENHDVINHSVNDVGYWVNAEQRKRLLYQLREEGYVQSVAGQWKTRSGDIRDMLISLEAIDIEGQACVLGIGIDITDMKRADENRLEAEKLRIELEKEREVLVLKDRFISTMSHEFRTPLAVIMAAKEALEHYYDRMKPERRTEHFANIAEQIRYLTNLLDEILTVSKARAGKMQFQPAPLNLTDYCRKLFEQVQTTDKGRHHFSFTSQDIPDVVEADKTLLQHILINLLSNAVKYSPPESNVALNLSCMDSSVIIQVRDEGMGIPEIDLKHLFEPFYRASNVGSFEGTGLGLAIVKECAEAHGGSVTCESVIAKGTLFTVRLPLKPCEQDH